MADPFRRKRGGGQIIRLVPAVEPVSAEGATGDPTQIERRLNQAIQDVQGTPSYDPGQFMDKSRKTIAYWFVVAFILIIGFVLLLVPIYNAIVFHSARVIIEETTYQPLDVEKVLATIGTLLGTPLGFVVGYYFKEEHGGRTISRGSSQK